MTTLLFRRRTFTAAALVGGLTACSDGDPAMHGEGASPRSGPPGSVTTSRSALLEACTEPLRVGTGIGDVTGPITDIGTGYNSPGETMEGLGMRLYARSIVVESPCSGQRVAFSVVDALHMYQGVTLGVLQRLRGTLGGAYTNENTMIAATHGHASPTNASWRTLYNAFAGVPGYDGLQYDILVKGIAESIERAHQSLRPATASFARGPVGLAHNRSLGAYLRNADRDRYGANVEDVMDLVRFRGTDGRDLGLLNWYGVHGTSLSKNNRLLHGDNKGWAAYALDHGDLTPGAYVAAFAQGTAGDVSPNEPHPDDVTLPFLRPSDRDPTLDDYDNPRIHGTLQRDAAVRLASGAGTALSPTIDVRQTYVDFQGLPVDLGDAEPRRTCIAAIGVGFLAGTEEGAPDILGFIKEGDIIFGGRLGKITVSPALQACHKEKVVILPVGDVRSFWPSPIPWVDTIVPIQIIRIGELAIVGTSFEVTTMAGRRLRERLLADLAPAGVRHVVIATMANAYHQYLTTRDEYAAQNYEGAFTHFGPDSAAALAAETHKLALALARGEPAPRGPTPPDLSGDQIVHTPIDTTGVVTDGAGPGKYGDVVTAPHAEYARGSGVVTVVFRSAHPRTAARWARDGKLPTGFSYLEVQRKTREGFVTVATDADPSTRFVWKRTGGALSSTSEATIVWELDDAEPGEYRILHRGIATESFLGLGRRDKPFSGATGTFRVQ